MKKKDLIERLKELSESEVKEVEGDSIGRRIFKNDTFEVFGE